MVAAEVKRPWWRRAVPPFLLLLIIIGFFWKLLLTNQYSWLQSPDLAYQVLPWFQYQATQFHQHVFPLWDPREFAGQSLIGQDQPGLLYPLNWILFSLPMPHGQISIHYLNWYYMLIHYLGALFCYWLCRDLGRSELASIAGGISFGLGGYMGNVDYPQMLNGAIWGPLVFLFLFRALRDERPKANAAFAGLFLGISWLGGHHVVPIFLSLAAMAVWLYSFFEGGKPQSRRVLPAVIFLAFAACAGAAQMWPTFSYAQAAVRWVGSSHDPVSWPVAPPYTVLRTYALEPKFLIGIIAPAFEGGLSTYTGITALALAGLGLAYFWKRREIRLLCGVGLAGLLLAAANNDVFHGILYSVLPMVGKVREPVLLLYFFHFAIAALAAFGLDAAMERRASLRRVATVLACFGAGLFFIVFGVFVAHGQNWEGDDRILITVLASFALAGLFYRLSRAGERRYGIPVLMIALYLVELGNSTFYYLPNKEEKARNIYLTPMDDTKDIAAFLHRQPGPVRVLTNRDDVPFNFGDWYGIDSLFGYAPSVPANFFRLDPWSVRARRIFATGYSLSRKPDFPGQTELFRSSSGIAVYQNPDPMPRVWTVHDAVRVNTDSEARKLMQDPGFDLSRTTFSYSSPPRMDQCNGDEIRSSRLGVNETAVTVAMQCRGLVVLSENDGPGWSATIDGAPASIYDAFTTLRAVVVGPGTHTIRMEYRPLSFRRGAIASLLALFSALSLAFRVKRQSRSAAA